MTVPAMAKKVEIKMFGHKMVGMIGLRAGIQQTLEAPMSMMVSETSTTLIIVVLRCVVEEVRGTNRPMNPTPLH